MKRIEIRVICELVVNDEASATLAASDIESTAKTYLGLNDRWGRAIQRVEIERMDVVPMKECRPVGASDDPRPRMEKACGAT